MKFRKRPIVIEAVQFDGHSDPTGVFRRPEDGSPYVVTIHDQKCFLSPGDWVVPEPDGVHYYPIKPDVFAATYEPVMQCLCGDDPRAACSSCPPGRLDRIAAQRAT